MPLLIKYIPKTVKPLVLRNLLFGLVGHAVDFDMQEGATEALVNEDIPAGLLAPLTRELGCAVISMNKVAPMGAPLFDAPDAVDDVDAGVWKASDGPSLGHDDAEVTSRDLVFTASRACNAPISGSSSPTGIAARDDAGRPCVCKIPPYIDPNSLAAKLFLPAESDKEEKEEIQGKHGVQPSRGPHGIHYAPATYSRSAAPPRPGAGSRAGNFASSGSSKGTPAAAPTVFHSEKRHTAAQVPAGAASPQAWTQVSSTQLLSISAPGSTHGSSAALVPMVGGDNTPEARSLLGPSPIFPPIQPALPRPSAPKAPTEPQFLPSPPSVTVEDPVELHRQKKAEIANHNAKSLKYYKLKYPAEKEVGIIFSAAKAPSENPELGAELLRVTVLSLKIDLNFPIGCIVRPSYVDKYASVLEGMELKTRDGRAVTEIRLVANTSNRAYLRKFLRIKFVIPLEEVQALFALVDALYYSPHVYYERPGFLFQKKE